MVVWVWGPGGLGFRGCAFQLMGVCACGVGPSWFFFGERALYVNIEKKPGKNFVSNIVGYRPQLVMLRKILKLH